MKKILLSLVVLALAVGSVSWAIHRSESAALAPGKVAVATSYYPLYDFARAVGGDKVQVITITPAGSEPHDYEPSPRVLVAAQKARVFVYNGAHMEPWASTFVRDYRGIAVKASEGIGITAQDPHFWLDPVLAQHMVDTIRNGLIRADPNHAAYYRIRAAKYTAQLVQLDKVFQHGLAQCQTRTLITSHQAFGYLAARYDLQVVSIAGLSPEEEPSAGKLAALADMMRTRHLQYVFFESLVSPRLAATIALETGAKTLVFDPIEGVTDAQAKQGADYLSLQRQNLANLRIALACQ